MYQDHLVYNISFDIAGLIVVLSVLLIHLLTYRFSSRNNRIFRIFLYVSALTGIMDIATSYTISYSQSVPDYLNIVLLIIYQISAFMASYLGMLFIFSCIGLDSKLHRHIDYAVFLFYGIVILVNTQINLVFTFRNHEYIKGPMFQLSHYISLFFVLQAGVVLLKYRKRFTSQQFIMNAFYVIIPLSAAFIQVHDNYNLMTFFAGSVASLFMVFSLETMDYQVLQETLGELRIALHEVEKAKEGEMQANRAKSEFLARMSHEIRTPINGILGMNSMILKESRNPDVYDYASNIYSAGQGLLSLINDILDISKIESGKMEINTAPYRLRSVVNDCYHMVALRAKDKGLYLKTKVSPDLPSVLLGDEVRIRQIIVNLLNNAIKYTQEGGVTFTVSGRREEREGQDILSLIVSVSDTGIGIHEEDQEKIFKEFRRVDVEKNKNIEGSGLGLRITAQLVELMFGTISVESAYGNGSTFTVTVPQRIKNVEKVGEVDPIQMGRKETFSLGKRCLIAPSLKLLVVDDVALNLKVVAGFLKHSLARIDMVRSGEECLKKVVEEKYHIIFLDHMMPEMDGVETYWKMRTLKDSKNLETPVIMMTANAIIGAREEYLRLGFQDYLSKPVVEDELIGMIAKYVDPALISWVENSSKRGKNDIRKDTSSDKASMPAEKKSAKKSDIEGGEEEEWFSRLDFLDTENALLYCDHNKEFYHELLSAYMTEDRSQAMQGLFEREDWKNYGIQAHSAKSTARIIGATEVSEMAKDLEMAAKSGDIKTIKQEHDGFVKACTELQERLIQALK
ncbi:MAG: response regulator [Lachnospiraceae bacterium]|nr:response regulator [Lachnospiraceae bacterium]